MANEISMNIVRKINVLSESEKGWTKELNLISWNGAEAKYDLRCWSPDGEKCGKGITLTIEEAEKLCAALNGELSEEDIPF